MDVQRIAQEGSHVLRLEYPLRGHFYQELRRVVDLGGTVRRHAGVFTAVPRRQFLEDEQTEELSASLFDLRDKETSEGKDKNILYKTS